MNVSNLALAVLKVGKVWLEKQAAVKQNTWSVEQVCPLVHCVQFENKVQKYSCFSCGLTNEAEAAKTVCI